MRSFCSSLALAAIVSATGALAADDLAVLPSADSVFTKWGEESGWTIYVDKSRNTCLIERIDDRENVVQMGLTEVSAIGYLGVFTKMDLDLKEGESDVVVAFDDAIYTGKSRTKTRNLPDGYQGGYVLTDDPEFVEKVQRKYEMVVFPDTDAAVIINLDGSLKAIDAARKCYKEANS